MWFEKSVCQQSGLVKFIRSRSGGKAVSGRIRGPTSVRHPGGMVLWATILFLQGAGLVGSMTGVKGVPENITVMFLNPTSVRVSWSTSQVEKVEKYDVSYKPTDARVVAVVAGNSEAVTLSGLQADTQYQLVVTAVRGGKRFKSRPIVFRTLEPPKTSPQQDASVTGIPSPPSAQQPPTYLQIRGVEVGIVVLVLIVWAGAIALFFNRWGKIRMLLPYQPDYKEQLKVPGTGVCSSGNAAYNQHSSQHACSQHLHWSNQHVDSVDNGGGVTWPRPSRQRVNSAIDVAGFLSQEFLRRHGSTSRLCRKVRSADNLPLATNNRHQDRRISKDEINETDQDFFLRSNTEDSDKLEESDSRRQSIIEKPPMIADTAILETCHLQQSPRDYATTSSLTARRFSGWRTSTSHDYVRCPVRQPISMEERCFRRSCEPDFIRLPRHHIHHHHHHHHRRIETHSRSCDYSRRSMSIEAHSETQHFGLPILSISEPSPPDEANNTVDETL
ncbi:uncharacterized protein LOC122504834 isoform X3 [Leptopilina heterotoma]|uniref:uncharacterized protein LOC122504834 isoform X3 n=1 Tax=Leptopilina heterotoma TaxID=63436 RepID=UPI001CA94B2A|nr:uncharacterized protein LOC122504834 isoform X3 [Leptopilina heterotoma]